MKGLIDSVTFEQRSEGGTVSSADIWEREFQEGTSMNSLRQRYA